MITIRITIYYLRLFEIKWFMYLLNINILKVYQLINWCKPIKPYKYYN